MNLLKIKCKEDKTHYVWRRGDTGIYHHWEMSVLYGKAVLYIEGSREAGGYWGYIQLSDEYEFDIESIYSTKDAGLHFSIPDDCAEHLVVKWFKIIDGDSKLMLKHKAR